MADGGEIELCAGNARATIAPECGASVNGLWVGEKPVLRPRDKAAAYHLFSVASIVLAPFSNRISRPFPWRDAYVALDRDLASEAFPIHGDAFQRRWDVVESGENDVVLNLADGAFGPLRYEATLTFALSSGSFRSELSLLSRSDGPMPFGLGFHPWFPRDADTRLAFAASSVWEEDKRHLPATETPAAIPEAWDFSGGRPLPGAWINNGFHGWNRTLKVEQGRAGVSVKMKASSLLSTLIVFSPEATADFFCAEPVSHPVDAHNLPGMPGLATLAPDSDLSAAMELEWTV